MILDIVQYGHPVLRERCRPVEEVDDGLRKLVDDMIETMYAAQGVGLAAPQVGVSLRLAVVDVAHDPECVSFLRIDGEDAELAEWMPLVFINPELDFGDRKESDTEGCLSIQDVRAEVKRPAEIRARLPLLDGRVIELETDGLLARAIQHETDHLNGVLFIDRISSAAKVRLRRKLKRLAAGE
jgi:peptide deformylase